MGDCHDYLSLTQVEIFRFFDFPLQQTYNK